MIFDIVADDLKLRKIDKRNNEKARSIKWRKFDNLSTAKKNQTAVTRKEI